MEDQPRPDIDVISLAEINAKARTPAQLYEVCTKANYLMPAMSSRLCHGKFLAEVLNQTCYMPKNEQVRHKTLFGNPTLNDLHRDLVGGLRGQAHIDGGGPRGPGAQLMKLAEHLEQRQADRAWVLTILATLDKDNFLGYFKPAGQQPDGRADMNVFRPRQPDNGQAVHLPADVVHAFKQTAISTGKSKGNMGNLFMS